MGNVERIVHIFEGNAMLHGVTIELPDNPMYSIVKVRPGFVGKNEDTTKNDKPKICLSPYCLWISVLLRFNPWPSTILYIRYTIQVDPFDSTIWQCKTITRKSLVCGYWWRRKIALPQVFMDKNCAWLFSIKTL